MDESPSVPQLSRRQRRVLGVLVEKAKTTPESYPLSLNALTTGCNQKSNRSPQMQLSADDIENVVDELRELGAVIEVQSGSRVTKFRHRVYDWLGVDKVEAAVITELLLRGEQTVGELRGRASRMETIASLQELQPILQGLIERKLVLELTPAGRGQIISHGLYQPDELTTLRAEVQAAPDRTAGGGESAPPRRPGEVQELREEVKELRSMLEELQSRVTQLES